MGGQAVLKVLEERGLIKQCTNREGLETLMAQGPVTFYVGFDPTGRSLHVGHMVPLFAMAHLSKAGHKAIALIGGGTARIGDPSGKTETRKMLSIQEINHNAERFKTQIGRFIDFEHGSAVMLNNADWLAELNYIEFLRDIGRHFSVNRMLSFETYKMRMESGLSFIEFNYQLLQSYDFLQLFKSQGCRLQLGGDDQWGNIVAGADLVRRVAGEEVYGLTFPLFARSDGKKMGKTEKGAVFLDKELVSPYEFYQYWRNVADADVVSLLKIFTFLPLEEIRELEKLKDQEINRAKELLAYEVTKIVHGREEAERAKGTSRTAFSRNGGQERSAMPYIELAMNELKAGVNVLDLFAKTALCTSRGEARRLVTQGGASINGKRVEEAELLVDSSWLEAGELLLKAGKKRYFRVVAR